MIDWSQYATGGATRPDSFSGMSGDFNDALGNLFRYAPPEVTAALRVSSGYRSNERQAQLWDEALKKYGSPEEARKWVAPPGRSQHNHGNAADLKFMSPEAKQWVHDNAAKYGLAFPLNNEDWHIELASARGGAAGGNVLSTPQQDQPNALGVAEPPRPQWQYNALQLTPYRMT